MQTADRIADILLDIILMPPPDDLSGRHPSCPPTGCWEHRLKPRPDGYRKVRIGGKKGGSDHRLHRLVYETLRGTIADGLHLDHLCRNRGCCNPWHTEPVTQQVNILRGETIPAACAAKTHCPKGHAYEGANLYINPKGGRECCECRRERKQRHYERHLKAERKPIQPRRERDPEAERDRHRRYREQLSEARREEIRACNRERARLRYERNLDQERERARRYREQNPDMARLWRERQKAGKPIIPPNGKKTHCPKGHPYSGDNLHISPNGARVCRQCGRDRRRAKKATF